MIIVKYYLGELIEMDSDDESEISLEEEVPDFLIGNLEGIARWNDFLETKVNLKKELLNYEEQNLGLFKDGEITEEEYMNKLEFLRNEIGNIEEQMREFEENLTEIKQGRDTGSLRPAREAADDAKLMKKLENAQKKASKFLDEIKPLDRKAKRGKAGLAYILAAPYGPIPGKNLNIKINHPIIDQPFWEDMMKESSIRAEVQSFLENVDKNHLLNCVEAFLAAEKNKKPSEKHPDIRPKAKGGEKYPEYFGKLTFIQRLNVKNRYPILRIPKNVFVQLHLEENFEGEDRDFIESIVRNSKFVYVGSDDIDINVTNGLNWEEINAKGIGSIVMKPDKAQGKTARQKLRIHQIYNPPDIVPETKESRKFFDYVLPVSNRLFESLVMEGEALSNSELTYCWARLERSEEGILYLRRFIDFKNYLKNLLEAMDRNVKLTRNPTLIQGIGRKMEQIRYFLKNDKEMDPGTIETDQGPVEVSWTPEQIEKRKEAAAYLETNCGEVSEDLRNVLLNIIWTTFVTDESFIQAIERVSFILNEYTDLVEKAERYVAGGSGEEEINPIWLALMRGPIIRYSGNVRDWRPPSDLLDQYSEAIEAIRQRRREIYEKMEKVMESYTHYKKIEEQVELKSITVGELNEEIGNMFISKMVKEQMMEHSIWESALEIYGITDKELKSKRANLPSQQSFTSPADRIETRRLLSAKLEKCEVADTNSDLLENMLYNLTKTVKNAYKVARNSILSKKNEARFCEISSAGISDESLNSLLAMISYSNNDNILEIDPNGLTYSELVSLRSGYVTSLGNPEIDTYIHDRINAIDNILKTMEVDVDLDAVLRIQRFYQKRRGGRRRRRRAMKTATKGVRTWVPPPIRPQRSSRRVTFEPKKLREKEEIRTDVIPIEAIGYFRRQFAPHSQDMERAKATVAIAKLDRNNEYPIPIAYTVHPVMTQYMVEQEYLPVYPQAILNNPEDIDQVRLHKISLFAADDMQGAKGPLNRSNWYIDVEYQIKEDPRSAPITIIQREGINKDKIVKSTGNYITIRGGKIPIILPKYIETGSAKNLKKGSDEEIYDHWARFELEPEEIAVILQAEEGLRSLGDSEVERIMTSQGLFALDTAQTSQEKVRIAREILRNLSSETKGKVKAKVKAKTKCSYCDEPGIYKDPTRASKRCCPIHLEERRYAKKKSIPDMFLKNPPEQFIKGRTKLEIRKTWDETMTPIKEESDGRWLVVVPNPRIIKDEGENSYTYFNEIVKTIETDSIIPENQGIGITSDDVLRAYSSQYMVGMPYKIATDQVGEDRGWIKASPEVREYAFIHNIPLDEIIIPRNANIQMSDLKEWEKKARNER